MTRVIHYACLFVSVSALLGCTGLSGSSKFACKAPDGVACNSMSGTYHNSVANNLPGQQTSPEHGDTLKATAVSGATQASSPNDAVRNAPLSGVPLRTAPQVLRVWVAPYVDTDGDLRDQAYLYVTLNEGRWQIQHTQRQAAEKYKPVRQAELKNPTAPPPDTPSDASSNNIAPQNPQGWGAQKPVLPQILQKQ